MWLCVCACDYVWACDYVIVCVCMWLCMGVWLCDCVCVCVCMWLCMGVWLCVCAGCLECSGRHRSNQSERGHQAGHTILDWPQPHHHWSVLTLLLNLICLPDPLKKKKKIKCWQPNHVNMGPFFFFFFSSFFNSHYPAKHRFVWWDSSQNCVQCFDVGKCNRFVWWGWGVGGLGCLFVCSLGRIRKITFWLMVLNCSGLPW